MKSRLLSRPLNSLSEKIDDPLFTQPPSVVYILYVNIELNFVFWRASSLTWIDAVNRTSSVTDTDKFIQVRSRLLCPAVSRIHYLRERIKETAWAVPSTLTEPEEAKTSTCLRLRLKVAEKRLRDNGQPDLQ